MNKNLKVILFILAAIIGIFAIGKFIHPSNIQILDPAGWVASKERRLIVISTLLMLIVVVPVYILTFGIVYKYRESNKNAKYSPDWDGDRRLEIAWWLIPGLIITILAVLTWTSSHQLDPFRPLDSNVKPIKIQVVSMQWRWLFIYPQQNIASINYLQFPVNTPVDFELTSDAPMNSFWIPRLGGQIYTMPGMATQSHLIANEMGSFAGSSANISGRGFSNMKFTARSSSMADFNGWANTVKQSQNTLNLDEYNLLAQPSLDNKVMYFNSPTTGLFDSVVSKYMMPQNSSGGSE